MRAGFPCALEIKKLFQKPHTKVADVKKTGVELTVMAFNRHQEVDFIRENRSM